MTFQLLPFAVRIVKPKCRYALRTDVSSGTCKWSGKGTISEGCTGFSIPYGFFGGYLQAPPFRFSERIHCSESHPDVKAFLSKHKRKSLRADCTCQEDVVGDVRFDIYVFAFPWTTMEGRIILMLC